MITPDGTRTPARRKKSQGAIERTLAGISSSLEDSLFAEQIGRQRGLLQSLDPRLKVAATLLLLIAVGLSHSLAIIAALLLIGTIGVLTRRNIVIILMSIELILNAVNINLVAFSQYFKSVNGQVFAIFVIAVAAVTIRSSRSSTTSSAQVSWMWRCSGNARGQQSSAARGLRADPGGRVRR